MTKLIVDIGNSKIKIHIFLGKNLVLQKTFTSNKKAIDFLKESNIYITDCIVSSVAHISKKLINHLGKNYNTKIFNLSLNLPINIRYKTPETLGHDRIAAVSGAFELFPDRNILVIDAGTAITYDLLLSNRDYEGGNISPGISTRFRSLNTFTENLPLLKIDKKKNSLFGKNTKEAILCGVQNGTIYEIQGTISEFKQKYDDLLVIFTGGESFLFEKLLKNCIFAEPNLTAIGLNKILELNA